MWLTELKSSDLKGSKKYPFLVSLGSTEQHGPYGPLGTDTFIQDALLQKVEQQIPELIFLPTIPISDSTLQLGFPGSVTFKTQTVALMIKDLVDSLRDVAGFIIFISWHGGNQPIINDFIDTNKDQYPTIKLAHLRFGDEGTDKLAEILLQGPPDDHAGNTEISMMQFIKPQITGFPDINSSKTPTSFDWDKPLVDVFADGVVDAHPKWVVSGDIGKKLMEIYSDNLIRKIKSLLLTIPPC